MYHQMWQILYQQNVMSTVSTNVYNKKVRNKMDCYILHTVLSVISLSVIAIICYPYAKRRSKLKNTLLYQQYKNGE